MGFMRCFVALDIPDELRQKIAALQKQLSGLDVKLVEPENLHFTLKFLGEIDDATMERVSEKMRSLKVAPFSATIRGAGVFPSIFDMRVIWLGCPGIAPLQQSVEESLSVLFKKEKPSPHLTLARIRSPKDKDELAEFVEGNKDIEIGSFAVNEIKLKKSTLAKKGPVYEDVKVFELSC